MDLRVNDFTFKGINTQKTRKIGHKLLGSLLAAAMGTGVAVSCQNNPIEKDYFSKDTEYVTLNTVKNNQTETEEVLTSLEQTQFFPEKDNKIISAILTSLGIESLGCITWDNNIEAFGECSDALYKFYARKSNDGSYYGFASKLVGMDGTDLKEFYENENKTYAFIFNDRLSKNHIKDKPSAVVEFKKYDDNDEYIFGGNIYDMENNLDIFKVKYLNDNVKNIVYTLDTNARK